MRKFNTCFIPMCVYHSCPIYMYLLYIKFYFGPFYGSFFDRDSKKRCVLVLGAFIDLPPLGGHNLVKPSVKLNIKHLIFCQTFIRSKQNSGPLELKKRDLYLLLIKRITLTFIEAKY